MIAISARMLIMLKTCLVSLVWISRRQLVVLYHLKVVNSIKFNLKQLSLQKEKLVQIKVDKILIIKFHKWKKAK